MSVIGPDCSCGGNNPNCFRCDGGGAQPSFRSLGLASSFGGLRARCVASLRNHLPEQASRLAPSPPPQPQRSGTTGGIPCPTQGSPSLRPGTAPQRAVVVACHKPAGRSMQQCLNAVSRTYPNTVAVGNMEIHEAGLLLFTNHVRLATRLKQHAQRVYRLQVEGTVSRDISRRVAALTTGPSGWRSADIGRIRAGRGFSEVIAILPCGTDAVASLFRTLGHPIMMTSVLKIANVDDTQVKLNHFRRLPLEELDQAFGAIPGWAEMRTDFSSTRSPRAATGAPLGRSAVAALNAPKSRRQTRNLHPDTASQDDVSSVDHSPTGVLRRREGFNSLGQYFRDIADTQDWMDATRGMHIARESGRFGSHPTHDRFDDESAA